MRHIINHGTNQHLVILLHGTGGDAESMLGLGKAIDPEATLLSIEGDVNENGMNRYFARYPDGTFDLESLAENTLKLNINIEYFINKYELDNYKKTIVGYSNGANIATNLFKECEIKLDNAVLYHPSAVRMSEPIKKQDNLKVFMTYGNGDPYLEKIDFDNLKQQFEDADIKVTTYLHEYGHQLIQEEVQQTKIFLKE